MRSKNKSYFHFLVIKNNNIKNKKYYKIYNDEDYPTTINF